ncbi:MAG TPA: hypothetical protein VJ892_03070 [Candidatus Absconditabacterales bacterium]|nr:hypothetical protein [Candidatus Absconditabacterales bacterium]
MQKEKIIKIIDKHGNKLKIGGLVLAIVAMIMAVRTYINYTTIRDAITNVEVEIQKAKQEIAYTEKFLKPYLDSEYADYFLAHKNNILFYGEYIIRFESPKEIDIKDEEETKNNTINTPQESRKHFIKSKINS